MVVTEILDKHNIPFTVKGQDYVVSCLNPEHEDNNPSMHIDQQEGAFHCFSCGFKGNVFKFFNVDKNWQDVRVSKLRNKIAGIKAASVGLKLPPGAVPYNRHFRDIDKRTLAKYGAFTQDKDFNGRIVFPLPDITGKIRAFIGRYTDSNAHPKYMIKPSGAELPLFPAIVSPIKGSIILVEGIFDALNLIDKGLNNAVAVLGANNLQLEVLKALKLQGVHTIYTMFDEDDAGRKASLTAQRLLEEEFIISEDTRLELPDGLDPGDLSAMDIKHIKENLYGNDSNS
jgi:DNA primase